MSRLTSLLLLLLVGVRSCVQAPGPELLRESYISSVDDLERDYFVYLPKSYDADGENAWPVLIFLHGDGERGDGKEDLDFAMQHGPLYEAWIQKRDLPFIMVVPQAHMFGRDGHDGPEYLQNRSRDQLTYRLKDGTPKRPADMPAREWFGPMVGAVAESADPVSEAFLEQTGWRRTDPDLIRILDSVLAQHNADSRRVYLTGLSLGGFGTWYYASTYPERFAAILPIVGFPSVQQAETIAKAGIPAWVFSGGRDPTVQTKHFFDGMNKMDELGAEFRFTTEQDMFHDVWNRVYAGDDVYTWLLSHSR
jgi:predicted peptidase